jgi:cytochrome c-type biogenesis protein CcmF
MVLAGTSWPLISSLFGRPATFGPSWYNGVSLPVYVAVLALLGVAPLLTWSRRPGPAVRARLVSSLAAAGAVVAFALSVGAAGFQGLLLLFVCAWALAANAIRIVELGRIRLAAAGAPLAHAGFALMLAGVAAGAFWSTSREVALPLGRPADVLGRTLTFLGHVEGSEPQDRWRVDVREPGRVPAVVEVGMFRTGPAPDSPVLHRPAIVRRVTADLYIAPTGLDGRSGALVLAAEVSRKPGMGLLWTGTLVLGAGCCLAWVRRRADAVASAAAAPAARREQPRERPSLPPRPAVAGR